MKLSLSKLIHKIYGTSGECHIHAIGIVPNSETLGSYAGHLYRSTKGMRRLSWQILITTYKDMERGVEYEIRYQENVISQTGNQITVQFENEVRTFVLDEKYAARPRFEDDEQIVSAFTQYGRVKERIKKIQKELASLRS